MKIKPTDKGKSFSRTALGIKFPDVFDSHYEVDGESFLFVTINNGKYRNELHPDGIVHEPATDEHLVQGSTEDTVNKGRHILVRFISEGDVDFEYIGDEQYMIRYDQTRIKIFVK